MSDVQATTVPATAGRSRTRAWLILACAVLLVAIYLLVWTTYATNGLVARNSFEQLPPGAVATRAGADFRLLGLRQTPELEGSGVSESEPAAPGSAWVIAEIEVLRHTADENFLCTTSLASRSGREWDPELTIVTRDLPASCGDVGIGQPFHYEQIYQVPEPDAGQIMGVVINDFLTGGDPKPVLTPPR